MTNSYAHTNGRQEEQNPVLVPLGDCGLLVRFGTRLDLRANERAVDAAQVLAANHLTGVLEICSSLASVFIRYDPMQINFMALCHQVRLALAGRGTGVVRTPNSHKINIVYGGADGPDLHDVARQLGMGVEAFITAHNNSQLHVMAVGFAPGFVYCGLHEQYLHIPRREKLHGKVPAGSILFAAGQTAVTATDVPTGWHLIGRSNFRNFQPENSPPTQLRAGDRILFSGGQA